MAASVVFAFLNLVALLLMGVRPVVSFYLQKSPEIASIYSNNAFNLSVWTIGPRLFAGTKAFDAPWFHTAPLIDVAVLVTLTSIACVIAVLVYAFFVALKAQSFDTSFAVLVNTAVIVSPVAWIFYMPLVLISIAVLRTIHDWKTKCKVGLCLIAPLISQSVLPVFGSSSSFAIALLLIFPTIAILLLITAHRDQDRTITDKQTLA
jgi:hypothetical protein